MMDKYTEGQAGEWYLVEGRITRHIKFEASKYVVSASSTITGLGDGRLPTMQIINHNVKKLKDAVRLADEMYQQLVAWCRDVVGNHDVTPGYVSVREPAKTSGLISDEAARQLLQDDIPF